MWRYLSNSDNASLRRVPVWMRWAAVLCLFLILGASTAETCHTHPEQSQTTPDHCPLCIAIHSALPTALHSAQAPELSAVGHVAPRIEHQWSRFSNHEVSGRAPPQAS